MLNMEELISRISRKISEGGEGEVLATKLDFEYAYGQKKIHKRKRETYASSPLPEEISKVLTGS